MFPEFSSWTPDTPKKYVTIEKTEYSCVYCGRGSDKKDEVFSEGGCKHCGGPGKEYIKTTTLETLSDTGRKILLIDSFDNKSDTDNLIEEIKRDHNIEVIRFSEMVQSDMSASERIELAKRAALAFGLVLIVASEQVNIAMGKIPATALDEAMSNQKEGAIKPVVLLSNIDDFKYLPEAKKLVAVSLNDNGFEETDFGNFDDHIPVLPHRILNKVLKPFKESRGG